MQKKLATRSWRALDKGLSKLGWDLELHSSDSETHRPSSRVTLLLHNFFSWRRKSEEVLSSTHLTIRNAHCFPASRQSPFSRHSNQTHRIKTKSRSRLHKIHTLYHGLQHPTWPARVCPRHSTPVSDFCVLNTPDLLLPQDLCTCYGPLPRMFFFQISPWLAPAYQSATSSNATF